MRKTITVRRDGPVRFDLEADQIRVYRQGRPYPHGTIAASARITVKP
jgi:hypothetical protein